MHRALVSRGPGKERDLVYRDKKERTAAWSNEPTGEGGTVAGEAGNKLRLKQVQVIRPTEMAQVPDHVGVCCSRGAHNRQHAGEIVSSRLRLDQVPAHTFARDSHALSLQPLIIQQCEPIMSRGCN